MAFDPKSADFDVKYIKLLGKDTVPVVMTVANTEGTISRVVSLNVTPCVEQIIPSTGSAQVDGKLSVKVLVEKVEGGYSCLESTSNFTTHIMNSEITPETEIFATAHNVGVTAVQASEQAVTFTANILVKSVMIETDKVKYVEDVSVAEQKKENLTYSDLIAATSQNFDIEIESDLPPSISQILCVESKAVLNKAEAGNDVISLNGEIYTNIIYLSADDQPKLKNQRVVQNFTHEVLANNVVSTDIISATIQVCSTSYEVQGELNSAKSTIILKNSVHSNIFVRQNKTVEVVADAFCPRYNLNTEYASFLSQSLVSSDLSFEKIDGSIVLGEDSPRIDRVLAVCAGNIIEKTREVENGEITFSGIMNCNIVYILDDDEGTTQSVFAEVPFTISLKRNADTDIIAINIVPRDIEARNKKSKEIDILAELAIETTVLKTDTNAILQSVSLGEKRPENSSAIGIYVIPEAEDLWQVSKVLNVSGDLIMAQNPDLIFPITSPSRIIIYRERKL